MEWTWREQILLFLQCGGLGLLLGTTYDWVSVWGQLHRSSRATVFCMDSLFGLLAALVTFFFSLATMDGRLHPLLFAGSALGVVVQRCGISRLHRRVLYRLGVLLRSLAQYSVLPFVLLKVGISQVLVKVGNFIAKTYQKLKKIRKKTCNSELNLLK